MCITMSVYLMNIKHILVLDWKLISKHIILPLLAYLLDWVLHLLCLPTWYGPTINKICASARNKDSLFFRWWLRYRVWILKFETAAKLTLNTLVNTRFVAIKEKSISGPTKIITWLGISFNVNKGCLYVSKKYAFQIY